MSSQMNIAAAENFTGMQHTEARDVTLAAESNRTLAEMQAAVAIAMRRPRNEDLAQRMLDKALQRKSFCERANYVFKRQEKEVKGPSVSLAREIARLWGNIQYGYKLVHNEDDMRTIEAFAWDLESNARATEQITFRKVREKRINGRLTAQPVSERDLREITARHGAIGVRNCVFQLIPRDVTDDASDKATEVLEKKVEKKKDTKKILTAFEKIGVSKKEIEGYLGHSIEKATSTEIVSIPLPNVKTSF